jgi:hypothetical protein
MLNPALLKVTFDIINCQYYFQWSFSTHSENLQSCLCKKEEPNKWNPIYPVGKTEKISVAEAFFGLFVVLPQIPLLKIWAKKLEQERN